MEGGAATAGKARPGWVLALLFLIYICNTMDRHVLGVLAEPIRKDLHLSDTQLGLLNGLVFALFYTVFGIPAGWLADRFGRIRVIVGASMLWSICSMMGGFAQNFTHLALSRIGVGIGESGGSAPSYSLVSSFYPPHRRGAALGVYHLGAAVAIFLVSFVGAWVTGHYSWRAAVIAVSLPGVIIALVLWITVREPQQEAQIAPSSMWAGIKDYVTTPLLLLTGIAAGFSSFSVGAMSAWVPAFLMRVRDMELTHVGSWYGLTNAAAYGGIL